VGAPSVLPATFIISPGQIESVYIDMPGIGLARFAPAAPARGSLFSARRRLGMREARPDLMPAPYHANS